MVRLIFLVLLILPMQSKNKFMMPSCRYFLSAILLSSWGLTARAEKTLATEVGLADAYVLLDKAMSAARNLDYSGVFVMQQGQQIHISRISHINRNGHALEKLENLDGDRREIVKTDNEIRSYLPALRRILVESRSNEKSFPAWSGLRADHISLHYQIHGRRTAEIAGRTAIALTLEPRDHWRYGYRLWIDKATCLLLRAQTLNEKAEVVEQIAFHELTINKLAPARVTSRYADVKGWRVEKASLTGIDISPWSIKWVPDGFVKIRAVKRLTGEGTDGTLPRRELVQFVYSDGLAGISVFVEPWAEQKAMILGRPGALNVVGKRQGEFWLTIVGEVPLQTVRQVADSIELNLTK